MAKAEKQIIDIISSALSDACYHKKNNMFYRISNGIAFCINIEHPGLYYVRYFIIPLYLPQKRITYTYGNRMNIWWDGKKDREAFLEQVSIGLKNDILPFFNRIDGVQPLFSFLQQDYQSISSYFSCPQLRIALLVAYTALILYDEKSFSGAVSETRTLLSRAISYSPNVILQIQNELDELEKKGSQSKAEIDQYYQEQIIQSSYKCFPWHKLTYQSGDG